MEEANQPDSTGRASDQFNLRLPAGLRQEVKRQAATNRRSMNAEIVVHLEEGLRQARQEATQ